MTTVVVMVRFKEAKDLTRFIPFFFSCLPLRLSLCKKKKNPFSTNCFTLYYHPCIKTTTITTTTEKQQ